MLSSSSTFSHFFIPTLYIPTKAAKDEVKVFVNVYDLNPVNRFLSRLGVGLYHSGVEIDGSEYSFASKGKGIFKIAPRKAKGVRFREQIEIGTLERGREERELQNALDTLHDDFQPDNYDLVTRNCNHFCNELVIQLVGKPLPSHVNRMSYIWTTGNIVWLVPESLRRKAPVGDKNLKAYGGIIPFLESIFDVSAVVIGEWLNIGNSLSDIVTTSKGLSCLLEDCV